MDMRYSRTAYVQGSAAPAIKDNSPVRVPRRSEQLTKEEIRRRQADRYAQENRRRAAKFGALYTFVIAMAVVITMFSGVSFIKAMNQKTENDKKVVALANELENLKENNDTRQVQIDTSINYDYIYKVATEELGMIHARKKQIIEYKSEESEYVIQYSGISSNK